MGCPFDPMTALPRPESNESDTVRTRRGPEVSLLLAGVSIAVPRGLIGPPPIAQRQYSLHP